MKQSLESEIKMQDVASETVWRDVTVGGVCCK